LVGSLVDTLPPVRGKLTQQAPLHKMTWLHVGGPAEVLFQPADEEDLISFLKNSPSSVPMTMLGASSNLLVRDGGIDGVVIKLGPQFARIEPKNTGIHAGTGAMDLNIARQAQKMGLSGLEFLCGIPGTLGGALKMNAGAHGSEIKDVVTSITLTDRQGNIKTIAPEEMGFAYRKTQTPTDWIFLSAVLQGTLSDKEAIAARMKEITGHRTDAQPIRERTAGSTFANPNGHKAWKLIDEAGCRGLTIGGAMMSEHHCNFMINKGTATAADFENLGEEVRRRVLEKTGIELRWEVRRIGKHKDERKATDD